MAYKRNVEIFEEAYEKKDAKSVVSYVARDGRKRYIAGSKNPSGSDTTFVPDESGNVVFTDGSGTGHELLTARGLGNAQVIETTWQELKDARDDGELIAGSLYRITDYQCTTTQENTQSAGHQFDIVLLALSESKLAEEGWAMEHPTDVYDVTFGDGVTKKCWIYIVDEESCNVVLCDTLLGIDGVVPNDEIIIDNINKTAIANLYSSADLIIDNLPYNYFQNSNLSAWKVWYCLDNDTARFAWADDSVSTANIVVDSTTYSYKGKKIIKNVGAFYEWEDEQNNSILTESETPAIGDDVFTYSGITRTDVGSVNAYDNGGGELGRGVIYRLIDEWGNDVPYDFKNIQFIRPLTDGEYDPEGEDTWVYTFNAYDVDNSVCLDCSIINGRDDIVHETEICVNNTIKAYIDSAVKYKLSNNAVIMLLSITDEQIPNCMGLFIDSESDLNTIESCYSLSLIKCTNCSFESNAGVEVRFLSGGSIQGEDTAIYISNKKVLTEE